MLILKNEWVEPEVVMAMIFDNGEVEFYNGYTPDKTALVFWDTLAAERLLRCPTCGK